jgi:hypothetical protein
MKLVNATAPDTGKIKVFFDTPTSISPYMPALDILPLDDSKIRDFTNSLLIHRGSDDFEHENFFEKHLDDFLKNPPPSTEAPRSGNRIADFIEDVRTGGKGRVAHARSQGEFSLPSYF